MSDENMVDEMVSQPISGDKPIVTQEQADELKAKVVETIQEYFDKNAAVNGGTTGMMNFLVMDSNDTQPLFVSFSGAWGANDLLAMYVAFHQEIAKRMASFTPPLGDDKMRILMASKGIGEVAERAMMSEYGDSVQGVLDNLREEFGSTEDLEPVDADEYHAAMTAFLGREE